MTVTANMNAGDLVEICQANCPNLDPTKVVDHRMPQIIPATEMPNELYHAQPSLSNSRLKYLFSQRPARDFWVRSWFNPRQQDTFKETAALKFGKAAHMLLLEGELEFHKNWSVKLGRNGEKSKTTKEPGMLAEEEYETLMGCREALLAHPLASKVLAGAKSEVSMFCTLPVLLEPQAPVNKGIVHVPVRVRHDIWKPGYSADLKFVDELSTLSEVGKDIANYGYATQADFYPRVMAACDPNTQHQNFVTIFVEKTYPHKVLCVTYERSVMQTERNRVDAALELFAKLLIKHGPTEEWPGFDNRVYTVWPSGEGTGLDIELPMWWNYI